MFLMENIEYFTDGSYLASAKETLRNYLPPPHANLIHKVRQSGPSDIVR